MMYTDNTIEEINSVLQEAWSAFHEYRKLPLTRRAEFMHAIAVELENCGDELIKVAMEETNLPEARLRGERARTIFQLNSYGDACKEGNWLDARIDTAIPDKTPPKPDIRKMLVPLGPIVVFGSSNFPFAYSTAGGDTACAFAAGCPVVVKAHPAHARTSTMVAAAIEKAALAQGLPTGIFAHVYGASFEVGKALVTHPLTKAVGFTGSFIGGKQLFDWANQRKEPIPVFAEMGSINPVFLLPEKLKSSAADLAKMYAGSITLGVGQFCTNPGLIVGIEGEDLEVFIKELAVEMQKVAPATMLHAGIAKSYSEKKTKALAQPDVETIATATSPKENQGEAVLASAHAKAFLNNPVLHQEVFGPYSIVIRCKDEKDMQDVALNLEGQLTATLMATENDMRNNEALVEAVKNLCGRFILNGVPTGVEAVKNLCGRFILNGVPTGVEVCISMHHGGPYPSTTDSRFTSVGADGIRRFARPIAFQNWPDSLLPEELKNGNPLGIWRMVNNVFTKDAV